MTAIAPDDQAVTLKDIRERLIRIEEGQQKLAAEVAHLQGQVSQLPTSWLMLTAIVATVFTVTATTAGVLLAVLNYAKTL